MQFNDSKMETDKNILSYTYKNISYFGQLSKMKEAANQIKPAK